ncbi:MAG TPA: ATP-dependent DNA helicase RecG [Pyrinomonadaceae bacterium]|nr:ATP-dependent DNA helicase RecG [Pyrinomonadaceae bacterium]
MPSSLTLETPINELYRHKIARVGQHLSRKLATALAHHSGKKKSDEVTIEDILSYLPMRYEDRSNLARIRDLESGVEASLELYVRMATGYQVGKMRDYRRPRLYIFEVSATDKDHSGRPVVVWWFVSGPHARDILNYYKKKLTRGARFLTFGKWEWDSRRGTYALRLHRPGDELELLPTVNGEEEEAETGGHGDEETRRVGRTGSDSDRVIVGTRSDSDGVSPQEDDDAFDDPALAAVHVGRTVPIYRKLGDFTSKRLREIIHATLQSIADDEIKETLPPDLLKRRRLMPRARAFRDIHFPLDSALLAEYERARSPAHHRLIFEDFFWLALGLGMKRGQRIKESKGASIRITPKTKEAIAEALPFKLTNAQRNVVKQIFADMQSDAPMNRLLQGDVGSGKTIVALVAMLAAMESGYQTALMAPTEILAEQHARNIKRLLRASPYRVELLTGSLRAAEKRRLHAELASGDIKACIGTHALVQESVSFKNLGLAVIDEQHRFGVMQRAELRARGFNPDVLVMTATPIPRSLAMTVYGDLDVSVIDEMPPGRTPVETMVFADNTDDRKKVKRLIDDELKAGRQVYVVYPLVEESEKMDLKDATQRYEYLRDKVFTRYNVGLVHGKMKSAEKDEVMRRFISGEIQILVSTTVIEVGVDVPNASLMVVEHAERFGLSQLHQLRGRVGRGAEKSYCVLLTSDKRTSVAEERLGIMEETSNGFLIAEKDLELRGAGELLGTKQSGLPELRLGNLVRDQSILEQARKEADYYLTQRQGSTETARMIKRVQADARFGLAVVG